MNAFWFTLNFGFAALNLGQFFLGEGHYFSLFVGSLNFLVSVHCFTKMLEKVPNES